MGKNQISSFACNTIKSFSNNDKWREQRDVSQLRRRSPAAAKAPLHFFNAKINKNPQMGFSRHHLAEQSPGLSWTAPVKEN